jgi:serine/threonine-protein kinase
MTPASRLGILLGAALASTFAAQVARADPSSGEVAMAETLFVDAKQRMASGDYASACPKLAESYRLDPGGGTLTALAVCHEHIGKTATAWAEFGQVASEAHQQGRLDRETFARQHIAALEPGLSKLTVRIAPETAQLPNVQVRRDGALIGPASWGVASPIDPGDHVIEAGALDKHPWRSHVVIDPKGDSKEITIPALTDQPAPSEGEPAVEPSPEAAPTGREAPPPHRRSGVTQRIAGLSAGGGGIVLLTIGTIFGVEALTKSSDAKHVCGGAAICGDLRAVSENNDAKNAALASDILVGAGVAALGAGAFLFFTAPPGKAPAAESPAAKNLQIVPAAGLHGGGISLSTVW